MNAMQFAALPFRQRDGRLEIMLVTSRETRRWVVPKGWPMAGLPPHAAAAREAFEEAGLEGAIGRQPIGGFTYWKMIRGRPLMCTVDVFPFQVWEELEIWPERRQRRREWFPASQAAELADDALLGAILRRCEADPSVLEFDAPRRIDAPARTAKPARATPRRTGAGAPQRAAATTSGVRPRKPSRKRGDPATKAAR